MLCSGKPERAIAGTYHSVSDWNFKLKLNENVSIQLFAIHLCTLYIYIYINECVWIFLIFALELSRKQKPT